MIRGLIRWLRVAAMPWWVPLLFLPALLIEFVFALEVWLGVPIAGAQPTLLIRDRFLCSVAMLIGVLRVRLFHPVYDLEYRNWLKLTPWRSPLALPVGPIHLVPQDALWIGIILLVWHHPQFARLYLPICFLFGYLGMILASCLATGLFGFVYLLAFGMGEVVRRWYDPFSAVCVAAWLYLAAWIAIRAMLTRFPWELSWYWQQPTMQTLAEETKRRMMGWPFDQLHGRETDRAISPIHGTLVGLLLGWWLFCIDALITNPLDAYIMMHMALFGLTAAFLFVRTFGYWLDYRPPISFWGRLWTLRWIIPRYDHILVTPLLICLTSTLLPGVLAAWGVTGDHAAIVASAAVALLGLNMPPSFEQWRLTGFHRIVPGTINKQEFVKI